MNRSPLKHEEFEALHLPGFSPDGEMVDTLAPKVASVEPQQTTPELTDEEEREFDRRDSHAQANAYAIREQSRRHGEQATARVVTLHPDDTDQEAKTSKRKRDGRAARRSRGKSVPPAEHGSWSNWD